MRLFEATDDCAAARAAVAHALHGGQALYTFKAPRRASAFARVAPSALDLAPSGHLYDRNLERLRATAARLKAPMGAIKYQGQRIQHLHLSGAPLAKALELVGAPATRKDMA